MHSFLTNTIPDIKPSPDVLEIHPDKSIGIEEIRQVTSFLSKKPIQSEQNTIIIHQAHLLTLPAQNAFLKTLEEPPANSQIYLVTEFPDALLPTVLSRCQFLSADNKSYMSNMTYDVASLELFQRLLSSGVGDRLKILDAAKFDRPSALEFFNDLEKIIHSEIIDKKNNPFLPDSRGGGLQDGRVSKGLGEDLKLILISKTYLKSNVNLKLILDHFAIHFE